MKEYININGVDLVSGVNVLNIKYPAGYTTYMRSGTPADTVIIILEGEISCTVPGAGEYELLPGYVTAFPKYTERTSSYVADTHLLSIHITSAKPLFRDGVRQMRIEAMDSRQRGSLDMIIGSVNGERYRDSELISAVWGLLDCLLVTNELEPSPKYRAVQKIKAMIDNDFRSDTPISEYAKLAAVSESTLRRLFFEYIGLPPIYEGVRCERLEGAGSAGGEADTVTAALPAISPD